MTKLSISSAKWTILNLISAAPTTGAWQLRKNARADQAGSPRKVDMNVIRGFFFYRTVALPARCAAAAGRAARRLRRRPGTLRAAL
jgi:hypothetical protein